MYSAPSESGVLYWTRSPACVITACPAFTSSTPALCVTRSAPLSTTVNSSNSGAWPGSTQPPGLRMCAMLSRDSPEFTRPMYSSMIFGLLPAAVMRVGVEMSVGIAIRVYGIAVSIAIVNRRAHLAARQHGQKRKVLRPIIPSPRQRKRLRWLNVEFCLSGPGRKYGDVCCAQFGLGRGARREHPPPVRL
jgi:hypothetical protein